MPEQPDRRDRPERLAYLDHAATTPLRPAARDAMLPWLGERFGNPSGDHRVAQAARQAVDDRRAVPTGITRAPSRLWEPGDERGTTISPPTRADSASSTIHSPYYCLQLDIQKNEQRK